MFQIAHTPSIFRIRPDFPLQLLCGLTERQVARRAIIDLERVTNILVTGTMGLEVDDLAERLKGRCIERLAPALVPRREKRVKTQA